MTYLTLGKRRVSEGCTRLAPGLRVLLTCLGSSGIKGKRHQGQLAKHSASVIMYVDEVILNWHTLLKASVSFIPYFPFLFSVSAAKPSL